MTGSGPLAVRIYGAESSLAPLVALHGFTLNGAQFAPLAGFLDRPVHAPDLPGHGSTSITPVDVPTTIDALGSLLAGLDTPVPILGYSMGGRLALTLALDRPELVDRVVVVSSGPGIGDPAQATRRAQEDEALAARVTAIGVPRFLDEWLEGPLTSTAGVDEATGRQDRAHREENTAAGLAAALRGLGQGAFPYLGDRLGSLRVPLLAVSGGNDERYTEQAATLAAAVPNGRHRIIEGVGHNVVLEAPEALAWIVNEFLGSSPPRSGGDALRRQP